MGRQTIDSEVGAKRRREFMRCLLDDLTALEFMLERDMIEADLRRIGAEQELFLVDSHYRPAPAALAILGAIDDPRFTTELGLFNLEINLSPRVYGGRCLSELEQELLEATAKLNETARKQGVAPVLCGILPTLRKSDLGLDNMTPTERYRALNEAMSTLRGGAYEFHIKGLDELLLKHDSVMLESCNASFQVHFQVGGREFPNLYNIAQVVAAPVLAAGANSPLLFGRRLWRETRIALFQQAIDTRSSMHFLRERSPRVHLRRPLGRTVGARAVPGRHLTIPHAGHGGERAGRDRDARGGSDPRTAVVVSVQQHGLPLEPRMLRRDRRQAALTHRESRAPVRTDRRRRSGQRGLLVRLDRRAGEQDRRRDPADLVRGRQDELRRSGASRARHAVRLVPRRNRTGGQPDL
ncbi:MAG TPA: hypothetical protein VD788_01730 [Candidatus Polarisedimenticolaceae bacterium]|nr:hypothetical protein [Candidatus Polarisedimenticolaceae bacterium]